MKLPNFICVGAQKAGTTTLQDILIRHPNIFLSNQKEIKYFHRTEHFKKGVEWYSSFFRAAKDDQIIGDITPDYLLYSCVPERIFNLFGNNIKLIFILRNPVNRAYSQFNFHKRTGIESRDDFEHVIDNYGLLDYRNDEFINWYTPAYYIERGLYFNQIERFIKYFSTENMLFIVFEELFGENKQEELIKILNFIGVDEIELNSSVHSHGTQLPKKTVFAILIRRLKGIKELIKPFVSDSLYNSLRTKVVNLSSEKPKKLDRKLKNQIMEKFFINDIRKLELLIKKDLNIWKI